MAGTLTPKIGLYNPELGEVGWKPEWDDNFVILDNLGTYIDADGNFRSTAGANIPFTDPNITATNIADAIIELDAKITTEDLWNRTGTTLVPNTANDSLDMGSGNIITTGDVTGGNLNISNWNTAYTHSQIITGNPHQLDTDDVSEGSTNLYYTDARARASISETVTGLDYNNVTGVLSLTSGFVIPTTTDESNWNDAYSKRVDTWNAPISFSANVISLLIEATDLEVASGTNKLTILDSGIDHDATTNVHQDVNTTASPTFVDLTINTPSNIYALSHDLFADYIANEHIDWTSTFENFNTSGNVIIGGDLTVNGTTTTINTETVLIEDNTLVLNYGESGSGVTAGISGITIDRGSLTNYHFFFDEPTDTFRIGQNVSGDTGLQAVATREDSPIDEGVAVWDNSSTMFVTYTVGNGLELISGNIFQADQSYYDNLYVNEDSFTAGSVLFSNGSNVIEDNANLFYDDANDFLRISDIRAGTGSSGVLTLGGIGGTNNENLTLDFETTINEIAISTGTGVTVVDLQMDFAWGAGSNASKLYMDEDRDTYFLQTGNDRFEIWIGGALKTKWDIASVNLMDDIEMRFGSSGDVKLKWETRDNDSFQIGVPVGSSAGSGYVSIMENADMGLTNRSPLATSADPVLRWYSSDATQPLDYGELSHNQTNVILASGQGNIIIDSASNIIFDTTFGSVTHAISGTSGLQFKVSSSADQAILALYDATGNQLVITNVAFTGDHDHAVQDNPTIFKHSDTNPGIRNNEWGSEHHDKQNYILTTGAQIGAGTGVAQACTATNATNLFTDVAHILSDTDRIMIGGDAVPTDISSTTIYFVVSKTTDTFQVSLTSGGGAVTFSDDGTNVTWSYASENAIVFSPRGTEAARVDTTGVVTDAMYSDTGTLTLGGVGDTNNETVFIDGETTANLIRFGSASGVTAFNYDGDLFVGLRAGEGSRVLPAAVTDDRIRAYSDGTDRIDTYMELAHNNIDGSITSGRGHFNFIALTDTKKFSFSMGGQFIFDIFGSTVLDQLAFITNDNSGNQIIIGSVWNVDYDHALQDDPTQFWHDDSSPAVSNNKWGSAHHDGDNFIIETGALTGAGSSPATVTNRLVLKPTGSTIIGDGVTNFSEFETDGTLVFNGTATVWGDLPPMPITAAKLGSTAPTLATFVTDIEQYTFDNTNDFVIGATEITHKYKEGTNILPHIHWATNGSEGTAKGVQWQLKYTIGDFNEAFSAQTTTVVDATIPSSTPDRTHFLTSFDTAITGTNIKIGAYICWRLERIGTAHGNGEPVADPFGLAVGFHVEMDTVGSRTVGAK